MAADEVVNRAQDVIFEALKAQVKEAHTALELTLTVGKFAVSFSGLAMEQIVTLGEEVVDRTVSEAGKLPDGSSDRAQMYALANITIGALFQLGAMEKLDDSLRDRVMAHDRGGIR